MADALLAVFLLALALPRVWATSPGGKHLDWQPSATAVVLVGLQTLPIAVRRLAPLPVLATTLVAVVAHGWQGGQPEPDYLGVLIALYTVAATVPGRVSRWCGAIAVLVLPTALAQEITWFGLLRAVVLVALVWALGRDRRKALLDRARSAEESARRAARDQALRVARRDLARRERIARNLHDVLSRSLTMLVVQGETLKVGVDKATAKPIEALVSSAREASAAARAAVSALDVEQTVETPTSWVSLLASFRDVGMIIEADPRLGDLPVGDETGRCLHRVVHEGLTNALRHAGPECTVRIHAERSDTVATIELINNVGGDARPSVTTAAGYGLVSLRQDVAAIGGALTWRPRDTGWELRAEVPFATSGAPAPQNYGPVTPIPVVIVDDQSMIRQGLRLLLQSHPDVEVTAELATGAELVSFLEAGHQASGATLRNGSGAATQGDSAPSVVLLDLVMPGMDGIDVLAALRRDPPRRRPHVLVLTTYSDKTRVQSALALGADGFILKDSTGHQLITAIRAVHSGLTALSPVVATNSRDDDTPAGSSTVAVRQRLTPRESQVLNLLAEGHSNRTIARRLGVSEQTVKIHVSNVLSKLGVQTRTQAALLAHGTP